MRARRIAELVVAGTLAGSALIGSPAMAAGATHAADSSTTSTTSSSTTTTSGGAGQPSNPACSVTALAAAQQHVATALSERVTQLQHLLSDLGSPSRHLSDADKATLTTDISTVELPGIEALQPQVAQATRCLELRQLAHDMVYDFRVYVVMTPQTHLTIAADDESFAITRLTGLAPKMQQAISWAQQHGKDTTKASQALTDFQAQLAAATSTLSGVAATVLAQTPQGFPGNRAVFQSARSTEMKVRADLKAAAHDVRELASDVR